jgi:hypothetical protein
MVSDVSARRKRGETQSARTVIQHVETLIEQVIRQEQQLLQLVDAKRKKGRICKRDATFLFGYEALTPS